MGCYCFFVKQVTNRFKGEFAIEKIKNYTKYKHTKKGGATIAHPLEEVALMLLRVVPTSSISASHLPSLTLIICAL